LTVKSKPIAIPTEETICDEGGGIAEFDLYALNSRINGGLGNEVRYYENPNDQVELVSPYTTGTTRIFARVTQDGCESDPVPVDLRVLPAPDIDTARITACSDSNGIALFDLGLVEDSINLNSGFDVEWARDSSFNQLVNSPYIGMDTFLYARVFNGGCYSPFVRIPLNAIPGPVLSQVADTTICGFFILPQIKGTNLTGNEAYYLESNGLGDTLKAGDTIFTDTTLFIFDESLQAKCISQESFRVSLRSSFVAGSDNTISVCEGSQVNLFLTLDSADMGGYFTDLDNSGQLTDSIFNTNGLNGQNFRFQYNIDPVPPCPGDSSLITVQVVDMVSAGMDNIDSFCLGTTVDLTTLLNNADLGGEFFTIDPGPVINNGSITTQGLSAGTYNLRYVVGDGMTCPKDSAILTIELLSVPKLEVINNVSSCGEFLLPSILGQGLGNITAYFTGSMGTGTMYMSGDTIQQSTTLFVYSDNGLCSDEVMFEIMIGDEVRSIINSTLCPGETLQVGTIVFDEARPNGEVTIPGGSSQGCDSIITVDLEFYPEAINNINATLCIGEFIAINGNIYDENNPRGTEVLRSSSFNGCDSIIEINLTYLPLPLGQFQSSLCEGDSLLINGRWYSERRPTGTDTLLMASKDGCDSIVQVSLSFFPNATNTLAQTLCPGDFIIVNNVRYDMSNPVGEEVISGGTTNGCDSVVSISLNFFQEATAQISRELCFGQQLVINGTIYDENNPNGTEILAGQSVNGCDSIVDIQLTFSDASYNNVSSTLCSGESVEINQVIYDVNNPTGADTLFGASAAGCDSIILVNLQFYPSIPGLYEDTLCGGDNIRIGSVTFDQQNPMGTVTLSGASVNGCDSLVIVNISFEGGQLTLPNEYSIGLGGNSSLNAIFTGDIAQITWSPANGLSCTDCLNPVANPSQTTVYTIEIVDRNGCFYTATTRVRIDENFKVFLPNAFTPNDDGVNDRFKVMTNDQVARVLYMRIFDRWGNLVYAEENPPALDQRGWDGTYQNKLMDPAVFVVIAEVEYINGQRQIFQTDLTLLR
jgi:gliding motility-associated-like protein